MKQNMSNALTVVLTLALVGATVWSIANAMGDRPRLAYTVGYTNMLSSLEHSYNISFRCIGSKVAEQVVCALSFSNARILQSEYSMDPETLEDMVTEKRTENEYKVEVEYLNAGQGGILSVRAAADEGTKLNHEVVLFGKDVAGGEALANTQGRVDLWKFVLTLVLSVVASMVVSIAATRWFWKRRTRLSREQ